MTTSAAAAFAAAPAAPAAAAPAAPAAPASAPASAPVAAAPVAAPAPIPAGTPPAPAANGQWFDGFENADVKNWTQAKGFKDPSAVAESAYNLEKLIGFDRAGRTLVIPKDDATPEEVKAFNAKLGVPATAAEYKLPLPEGSDPKLTETIQGWMHKAGATPKVAEALTKEFVAFSAVQKQADDATLIANSDKAFGSVTASWGKDADQNLELGKRFVSQMLPDQVELDNGTKVGRQDFLETLFHRTGGTAAMLKLFADAGKGLGEHRMRQGGDPGGLNSPGAAQAKITQLKSDPVWVKAYLGGDRDKMAEMQRLTQQAYPAAE